MSHPGFPRLQAIALRQHIGLEIIRAEHGQSWLELTVGPHNENANQMLHGGVLYTLCDAASYAALLSVLPHGASPPRTTCTSR